jgi:hypothetical protein
MNIFDPRCMTVAHPGVSRYSIWQLWNIRKFAFGFVEVIPSAGGMSVQKQFGIVPPMTVIEPLGLQLQHPGPLYLNPIGGSSHPVQNWTITWRRPATYAHIRSEPAAIGIPGPAVAPE